MAQQLPKRCKLRLVSFSSSLQNGHRGSSILFNKVRCWFKVLCPVKRPTNNLRSFLDSRTVYCMSRMLTACINCLAWRQLLMLRHRLFCSCKDHWEISYLIFIRRQVDVNRMKISRMVFRLGKKSWFSKFINSFISGSLSTQAGFFEDVELFL